MKIQLFKRGIAFFCFFILITTLFLAIDIGSFKSNQENKSDAWFDYSLVNEKVYSIKNKFSGYYLDVQGGGTSNGTTIQQYPFNFSNSQKFKVVRILGEANLYEIIPIVNQYKRIDIEGGQNNNGTKVQIYQSNSTDSQRFRIESIGNGVFKILTKISNYSRCITSRSDIQYDTSVCQWDYFGHDSSHWYFEDAFGEEIADPTVYSNKVYFLRNQCINFYMDCQYSSTENGTVIQTNPFNGTASQMFKVELIAGTSDMYKLKPYLDTSTSIDISAGSNQNGAKVQVWQTYDTNNQKFKIQWTGNEGNSFKILTQSSNFTKCLSLSIANLSVVQWDYFNDGNSDNDHWIFEEAYVDYAKTASVTSGQQNPPEFTFILPDARYYTLEYKSFNSNIDTYFTMTGMSGNIDSIGPGKTDSIYFKSTPGQRVTVKLYVKSGSYVPTVFHVRKFQSVMYGYSCSDIDTRTYIDSPNENMKNESNALKYKQKEKNHILAYDERGLQRLNSEIVYITGHGNSQEVQFANDDNGSQRLYYNEIINTYLGNVKLILFGSCESGAGTNNLVTAAFSKGADAVIGFIPTIGDLYLKEFGEWFFYYIRYYDILEAKNKTLENFEDGNPIKDVLIMLENGNFKIFDSVPQMQSVQLNQALMEQFEIAKNEYLDITEQHENAYRYHKTINGIRTDDFYDVEYNKNGDIIEISRSSNIIGNKKILPLIITETPAPEPTLFNGSYIFVEAKKYISYRNINNRMVPVETSYNNYREKTTGYGYQNVICTNLYDGTGIDPAKIMFVK